MSKIKNSGLEQYGAEPFEQQQFGTDGVEGVNMILRTRFANTICDRDMSSYICRPIKRNLVSPSDRKTARRCKVIMLV